MPTRQQLIDAFWIDVFDSLSRCLKHWPTGPPKAGTAVITPRGENAGFYLGDADVPTDKTLLTVKLPDAPVDPVTGKTDVVAVVGEVSWDRGQGPEPQGSIEGAPSSEYSGDVAVDGGFGAPEGSVLTLSWRNKDNSGKLSDDPTVQTYDVPDGEAPAAAGVATITPRGELEGFFPDPV